MFDHQTRSLWSHVTGECLDGKFKGKRLERLTCTPKAKWKDWKAVHPHTKVLSVHGSEDLPFDVYEEYHKIKVHRMLPMGARPGHRFDPRLPQGERVIGVWVGNAQKVYPLRLFRHRCVLKDKVLGKRLLVFHDQASGVSAVYEPKIQFPTEAKGLRIRDISTGTTWDLLTGEGVKGKGKGKRLPRLPHVEAYWFAWSWIYPKTDVYKEEKR